MTPCNKTDCPNYDKYIDWTESEAYKKLDGEFKKDLELYKKNKEFESISLSSMLFSKDSIHLRVETYKRCNECIYFEKVDNYKMSLASEATRKLLKE